MNGSTIEPHVETTAPSACETQAALETHHCHEFHAKGTSQSSDLLQAKGGMGDMFISFHVKICHCCRIALSPNMFAERLLGSRLCVWDEEVGWVGEEEKEEVG